MSLDIQQHRICWTSVTHTWVSFMISTALHFLMTALNENERVKCLRNPAKSKEMKLAFTLSEAERGRYVQVYQHIIIAPYGVRSIFGQQYNARIYDA